MPVKDEFSYSARWDSVGLCCGECRHQQNNKQWPNTERNYKCGLHNIPLRIMLRADGYLGGEWFCKSFENDGRAHPQAIKEFKKIKASLEENKLYGCYGGDGYLKEVNFEDLENYK